MNGLVEKFLDIEEKYDLWNSKLGDIKIWNRTRLELFRMIERFVSGSDIVTVSYRQQFTDDGRKYTFEEKERYFDELVEFYKGTELLIVNNRHRMLVKDGTYFCPITGMLSKVCDVSIKYCSQSYRKTEIEENEDLSVINYNKVNIIGNQHIDEKLVNDYVNSIAQIFERNLKVGFDKAFYEDFSKHILYVIGMLEYKTFYNDLLSIISPKAIVVASGYAIINSIIVEVANELGIDTIEMQHGQIGTEHIAYNSKCDRKFDSTIPKYMFVYGQFDIDTIRNYVCKDRMIVVGNLFLDEYIKKHRYYEQKSKKQMTALVVSYIAQNRRLVEFAIDLKKKHNDWIVIYRFHPEETIYDEVISKLQKNNIVVDMDFQMSVYNWVSKADYIISSHSTVLCEALCFNKKTFRIEVDDGREVRESEKYIKRIKDIQDFERERNGDFGIPKLAKYFYDSNNNRLCLFMSEIFKHEVYRKNKND